MAKPRPPLPGGPYLVVGLARSGVAAALALRARGEEVIGCDAGAPDDSALSEAAGRLSSAGVEVRLDASGEDLLVNARTLIKSPGVPRDAPVVRAALARATPVLGELELAWRLLDNEFVAVTGTNGKTTTSEWIGHIHREAGREVAVAGNVGTAASSLIGADLGDHATIVCECSSFQLEDTIEFSPEVAVLLNIAEDHLDRHPSFDAYVAAKLRVFANQGPDDVALVPPALEFEGRARRVALGTGPEAALVDSANTALPGAHNRQNAIAAAAACLARGIDRNAIVAGLESFAGVGHRLELVAVRDGVSYINDSKATNVASTLVALRAFSGPIHLIAGGRGKEQDFTPLAPLVAERCAAVYLIGEAEGDLHDALSSTGVPVHELDDLDRAVAAARAAARAGEVVLLSPACASYDQYRDFEERGEHFRRLV